MSVTETSSRRSFLLLKSTTPRFYNAFSSKFPPKRLQEDIMGIFLQIIQSLPESAMFAAESGDRRIFRHNSFQLVSH